MARALQPGSATQEYILHTFPSVGPYTVISTSCCRTGPSAFPNSHINNPNKNYRYETVIDFSKTTASPISLLPPIVDCPLEAECKFKVAAVDPDAIDPEDPDPSHLVWRLALPNEMGGSNLVQPPGSSINSENGEYIFDTHNINLGPDGYNTLYSTQVVIEDREILSNGDSGELRSKVVVDFFIRIIDLPGPPVGEISIPVRWCALLGSPSASDPAQYSDFDTIEEILDHRLVNLSNRIYMPQSQITFFSTPREQGYPIFANTNAHGTPGNGNFREQFASLDLRRAINECRQKWQETDPSAPGLIAINLRRFVDGSGNDSTSLFGVAMGPDWNERGIPGYQLISGVSVIDSYYLNDPNQKWLGHETGHALSLTHTLDPDNIDPLQPQIGDKTGNIMNDANTVSDLIENAQSAVLRLQATLIPGFRDQGSSSSSGSGTRVDTILDTPVGEEFIDVDTTGMTMSLDQSITHFVASTFGLFPANASGLNYYFAADLDNQSSTGGSPSDIGMPYTTQGIDIVGLVQVDVVNGVAQGTPTLWKYQSGQFVQIADPRIETTVGTLYGNGASPSQTTTNDSTPVAQIIQLLIPNDLLGSIATEVRLATIAQNMTTNTVDNVEGLIYLTSPALPSCQVNPDGAVLGSTVRITASDLLANSSVNVYLGNQSIASGSTDSSGSIVLDATIPANAITGTQVIYAHVVGTGVSAFCQVQLWAIPKFDVPPSPVDGATFTVNVGETLQIPIQASDLDSEVGDLVTLDVIGLPYGASFPIPSPANPISTAFTWTPTSGQEGSYIVVFTTHDSLGLSSTPLSVTITVAPPTNIIFKDSLESGTFNAWYWAETDGGDMSVSTQSAAVGNYGMKAVIDDNHEMVLYDETPNNEKHYSARFYFDPNAMQSPNDGFYLFSASSDTDWVACVLLEQQGTHYSLSLCGKNDANNWLQTEQVLISDEWQAVEIEWKAATSVGANNGFIKLYIGDQLATSINNIDNDTHFVTDIALGVIDIPNSASGTMYFDEFESRIGAHIGLHPNGVSVNPPPARPDALFSDTFENNNLTGWNPTLTKIDVGDLSTSASSAHQSNYGLQALIDDTVVLKAVDSSPANETQYRARFYFHPNSLTMSNNSAHFIFDGFNTFYNSIPFRLELLYESGVYKLRPRVMKDDWGYTNGSKYTISNAWHVIEIDWKASTASGANNGYFSLWIDGTLVGTIANVDNDAVHNRLDEVRLGATAGIDSTTSGLMFFDKFVSRRFSYIGQ